MPKKSKDVKLVQRKVLTPFKIDDFVIKKATPKVVNDKFSLFEEKHRPKFLKNVVGNKNNIDKIQKWIDQKKQKKMSKNFMIIFGHNGTGKTLISELILKENGYKIFELNSDIYPQKKEMLLKLEKVLSSKSVQTLVSGNNPTAILVENIEKTLGEGVSYTNFVNLLEKHGVEEVPVICTSSSEKIKKKYNTPTKLEIIKLEKPEIEDLVKFGAKVLKREGDMKITQGAIKKIIEASKFDIRKFLQYLKMMSLSSNKVFNKENIQPILNFSETDLFYNAYEALDNFFKKENNNTLEQKINICMIDQPLIIDLLYTNIPYILNKYQKEIYSSLDSISFSDLIQVKIFKEHNWELREYLITSSCLTPVNIIREKKGKIKNSYIIKKNQLNNLPCTCVKNKNIFSEIINKSKNRLLNCDLSYVIKFIYEPKIEKCLETKDEESLTNIVETLLKYGINFNDYIKITSLGFNKTKTKTKKIKDTLKKIWDKFDRKNLIEKVT